MRALTVVEFSPSPTSKAEQTTKLMTDDDLKPKIQDLEKMFDTDEECDADSVSFAFGWSARSNVDLDHCNSHPCLDRCFR